MAEVEKSTRAGETTARFIEFVMMQAQNASLFLGLIPNPNSGKPDVNLELARMFIDQLVMIQEKTRGNLSTEETNVLRNALTNLQMAYFEVAQGGGMSTLQDDPPAQDIPSTPSSSVASSDINTHESTATPPAEEAREGKKRFTKSYGS